MALGRDLLLPGQALIDGAALDLTALLPAPLIEPEAGATRSQPLESAVVADVHDRRGRELFGLCRRLGLDDEQANDAVQETFLRMWAESARGTVIIDPEGWAFRVAYRLAMDHHRLGRLARALADRLLDVRARDEIDPADRLSVWAAVDRLPPRQRTVVYLRYRADLSYERIAAIMGITANGARNDASAATATLRRRLASEGGVR